MTAVQIRQTDLETALQLRMTLSEPPRSREAAMSPGDTAPEAVHFGAYIEGQLVAVCSVGPERLPVLNHPDAWRLRGLIVLPDFRNRGLGPKLLQQLLQHVEAKPNPLAWSYVKRKLIPLYTRFDYHPTGYTYVHPSGGDTFLFGNQHTLELIREATGTVGGENALSHLGAIESLEVTH